MSLTGLDPNDPRPGSYREFVLGAGRSGGGSIERTVLLIGNKTSAGSETAAAISTTAVQSDADAVNRFGRRSELYAEYRVYRQVDPDATIYAGCVTESVGAAATVDVTFATNASAAATLEICFQGEKAYASVASGDTPTVIAAAAKTAINAASGGTWQCTADNSSGVLTVTASQLGPRAGLLLGAGLRLTFLSPCATTISKAAVSAGTTEDDATAVITAAAAMNNYYIVSPFHTTSALSATDNQTGELVTMCQTQNLPANGKAMTVVAGLVGTQAQATTVAASTAGGNSVLAKFIWQKSSDWSPAMIAAHWAATLRAKQIAYPAANLNGHRNSDTLPFLLPPQFSVSYRATSAEVLACLNNGVTPVGADANGAPYVVRDITSRSLNAQGLNDYKAREGHIPYCIHFAWDVLFARWNSQKQPNVAGDPPLGAKPIPLTSTPSQLKGIIYSVIEDLASGRPLGKYPGPIFAPDKVDEMKRRVVTGPLGAGKLFSISDLFAVEHLIADQHTINEVGPEY